MMDVGWREGERIEKLRASPCNTMPSFFSFPLYSRTILQLAPERSSFLFFFFLHLRKTEVREEFDVTPLVAYISNDFPSRSEARYCTADVSDFICLSDEA